MKSAIPSLEYMLLDDSPDVPLAAKRALKQLEATLENGKK
jgi:hypothetical protein